jgi:hypothetical protein
VGHECDEYETIDVNSSLLYQWMGSCNVLWEIIAVMHLRRLFLYRPFYFIPGRIGEYKIRMLYGGVWCVIPTGTSVIQTGEY